MYEQEQAVGYGGELAVSAVGTGKRQAQDVAYTLLREDVEDVPKKEETKLSSLIQ